MRERETEGGLSYTIEWCKELLWDIFRRWGNPPPKDRDSKVSEWK